MKPFRNRPVPSWRSRSSAAASPEPGATAASPEHHFRADSWGLWHGPAGRSLVEHEGAAAWPVAGAGNETGPDNRDYKGPAGRCSEANACWAATTRLNGCHGLGM